MKKIEIKKLSEDEITSMGIRSWPVWTKEISDFDWYYDSSEQCLIFEGQITVETDKETVEIKAGDFVTFPRGLKCVWHVKEPVRKHYSFED